MADRIRPHSERSRRTHDAGSKITSLLLQGIDIEPIRAICACPSAFAGATKELDGLEKIAL
jgi:hypothetical protein